MNQVARMSSKTAPLFAWLFIAVLIGSAAPARFMPPVVGQQESDQPQEDKATPEQDNMRGGGWTAPATEEKAGKQPQGNAQAPPPRLRQAPKPAPAANGLTTVKRVWRLGAKLKAPNNAPIVKADLTFPIPTDWPEQHVNLYEEEIPKEVKSADFRVLDNGIRQMVAEVSKIGKGKEVEIYVMMEITVHAIPYPERTDHLVIPDKPGRELRQHLKPSPNISFRDTKLKKQVKEIFAQQESAWEQIRGVYDWIHENIEVERKRNDMQPVGARETFKKKSGIPEDHTNLFIAMLRYQEIPCRTVWADNGEYAEFYLEDDQGVGQWYPAIIEGRREFGELSNPRPILQKGDSFKIPEEKQTQTLVVEHAKVQTRNGARPSVQFFRNVLPARE